MYDKVVVLFTIVGVALVSAKAQLPVSTTPNYFSNPTFSPGAFQSLGGNFGARSSFPTLRDFSNEPFGEYGTSNPFEQQGSQECSLCKRKLNSTDEAVEIGFPKFSPTSELVTSDFKAGSVETEDESNPKSQKSESIAQNNVLHRENVIVIPPIPTSSPDSQTFEDSTKSQDSKGYLPITSKPVSDDDSSSQEVSEENESKSSDKPPFPTLNSYPNAPNPLDTDAPPISVRFGSESEDTTGKPYGALSQTNTAENVVSSIPQSTGIPYVPVSPVGQSYSSNGFTGSPLSTVSPNTAFPQPYSPYDFANPYYSGISTGGISPAYSPYSSPNFSPYSRGSFYSRPFGFNRFGYNPFSYTPRYRPSFYNNGYFANNRFGYSAVPQYPSYYPINYNRNAFYQNTLSPISFRNQNANINFAQASQGRTPVTNTFNTGPSPVPQTGGGSPTYYGRPGSVVSPTFASPTVSTPTGPFPYSPVTGLGQTGFAPSSTVSPLQFNYQNSKVNPAQVAQSSTSASNILNVGQPSSSQTITGSPSNYGAPGSAISSTYPSSTPSTPAYSPGPLPYNVAGQGQSGPVSSTTISPLQFNYQNSNLNPAQASQSSTFVSSTGQTSVSQNVGPSGFTATPTPPTFASQTSTPTYSTGPYSVSGFGQPGFVQSTSTPFPVSYQNSNLNLAQAGQSSTPVPNSAFYSTGQPAIPHSARRINYGAPGSINSPTFVPPTVSAPVYSSGPLSYSFSGLRQSGFAPSTTPTPFYSAQPYSFSNFGQPGFATSTVAPPPYYSAAPGFPQINYNGQPTQ